MLNVPQILKAFLSPRQWFTWFWSYETRYVEGYDITRDHCASCNRFVSLHSTGNKYCSFHNVVWDKSVALTKPFHLFRASFEMWLRSRCGGDLEEVTIASDLLTVSSFLDYTMVYHPPSTGNLYNYCDEMFANYQVVHDFLEHTKLQAKQVEPNGDVHEKHNVIVDMRIADGLRRFLEFRKYQLPVKGIIENRYSASERVLEAYQIKLVEGHNRGILQVYPLIREDVEITLTHFQPQYEMIVNYFAICKQVRTLENGTDLDFATSFIALYLYHYMPEHLHTFHLIRVRDLGLDPDVTQPLTESRFSNVECDKFVTHSCDIASPIEASACIGKLQKLLTIDPSARAVILPFIDVIQPRLSKVNDYLLLRTNGLGLDSSEIEEMIMTLIFRVTGRVTQITDRLEDSQQTRLPAKKPANRRKRSLAASTPRTDSSSKRVRLSKSLTSTKIIRKYKNRNLKPKRLVLELPNLTI